MQILSGMKKRSEAFVLAIISERQRLTYQICIGMMVITDLGSLASCVMKHVLRLRQQSYFLNRRQSWTQ